MPKMKSNRAAAKRFRLSAGGVRRQRAYRRHILTKKSRGRKRSLRATTGVSPADDLRVRRLLGVA